MRISKKLLAILLSIALFGPNQWRLVLWAQTSAPIENPSTTSSRQTISPEFHHSSMVGLIDELNFHLQNISSFDPNSNFIASNIYSELVNKSRTPSQQDAGLLLMATLAAPKENLSRLKMLIKKGKASPEPKFKHGVLSELDRWGKNDNVRRVFPAYASNWGSDAWKSAFDQALFRSVGIWFDGSKPRQISSIGILEIDGNKDWSQTRGPDHPQVNHLLRAVRTLHQNGIDLNSRKISLVKGLPKSKFLVRPDDTLLVNVGALKRLNQTARDQGLTLQDKLVQAILKDHLTSGIAEPLRLNHDEVSALGYAPDISMRAQEAIALFKNNWLKKYDQLLYALRITNGVPLEPLETASYPTELSHVPVQILHEIGSKLAIFIRPDQANHMFAIGAMFAIGGGEIKPFIHYTDENAKKAAFDAASKTFFELEPEKIHVYPIEAANTKHDRDPITGISLKNLDSTYAIAAPPQLERILLFPEAQMLLGSAYIAEQDRSLVYVFRFNPAGRLETVPSQFLEESGRIIGGAYDPLSRFVYFVTKNEVRSKYIRKDGVIGESYTDIYSSLETSDIKNVALNSDSRMLAIQFLDDKIRLHKIDQDGRIESEKHFDLVPHGKVDDFIPLPHGFWLIRRGEEFSWVAKQKLEEFFQAQQTPVRQLESAVQALAQRFFENVQHIKAIAEALTRPQEPKLLQQFWGKLTGNWDSKTTSTIASLQAIPNSEQWYKNSEATIKNRMPTLWSALRDPGKFLFLLSFLRLVHPYDTNLTSELPPIALAQKAGLVFKLNELNIVPGSQSFRRSIIYVEDAHGRLAVELKLPGERDDKQMILRSNFNVAREYHDRYPNNTDIVMPYYYGQFEGNIFMYGKTEPMRFTKQDPLGIAIFEYVDGPRARNATAMLGKIAHGRATTFEEINDRMAIKTAITSIRLHEMGWRGSEWEGEGKDRRVKLYDTHQENVRFLADGNSVLVGDFGSFRRDRYMTIADSSWETLHFLFDIIDGEFTDARIKDLTTINKLKEILPQVAEGLTKGISDPSERARLEKVARKELGLDP